MLKSFPSSAGKSERLMGNLLLEVNFLLLHELTHPLGFYCFF